MSRQRSIEKIQASDYVSIGELARLTGCRYSTLKFYTEEGMLPFEQPEENLTRRFPREKAVARLQEIQRLKAQGLSIPEIKASTPGPMAEGLWSFRLRRTSFRSGAWGLTFLNSWGTGAS